MKKFKLVFITTTTKEKMCFDEPGEILAHISRIKGCTYISGAYYVENSKGEVSDKFEPCFMEYIDNKPNIYADGELKDLILKWYIAHDMLTEDK